VSRDQKQPFSSWEGGRGHLTHNLPMTGAREGG
jgi:hypothetical protein